MKWFKKNKFRIFTYLFCAFAMGLFAIVSFSCKTYAYEVIDNDNTPVLKSRNLLDSVDVGYAYRASNGVKFQTSGYICSTNFLVFDYYSYINISLFLNNTTDVNCFITLYDSNYTFIKSIQWINTDNTIFNNGLSCRFNINSSDRNNTFYFTFTCASGILDTYDVMINDGYLPLPYESYNLYSAGQYINTKNEFERYFYYEQYVLASNCNYNNNCSYIVVNSNSSYVNTSLQFGYMYRFLDNDTYYTFEYTSDSNTSCFIQLVYQNNVIDVHNGESFIWYKDMNTLRIYFENTSSDLGAFQINLFKNTSLNPLQLQNVYSEEINNLNNTISNLNDTLNARNQIISQLQIAYNDLNTSYENMLNGNNFANLFFTIAETPFASFKQIWSVDFLGVNLAGFVTGILFIGVLIWVVKKIF